MGLGFGLLLLGFGAEELVDNKDILFAFFYLLGKNTDFLGKSCIVLVVPLDLLQHVLDVAIVLGFHLCLRLLYSLNFVLQLVELQ